MGEASVDFLILQGRTQYLSEYERFLDITKKGLLSSVEIIKRTGISEGANLGKAIRMVKKAQFTNKIATAEDGVKFLLDNSTML
jgi:hypothetical protein